MPGMAGKVLSVDTYSDNGHTVQNPNCRESSIVIITPISDRHPLHYYVNTDDGEFTVESRNVDDDYYDNNWSFSYLIINQ